MNRILIIISAVLLLVTGCRHKGDETIQDSDTIRNLSDTAGTSRSLVFMDCNAVIVGEGVRLRRSPDINAEVLDKLNTGILLKIIRRGEAKVSMGQVNECDPEGFYWFKVISSDGKTGWIYGEFIYKLIIPGMKHEKTKGITGEILKKSFIFNGKPYRMGLAEAQRTALSSEGDKNSDTLCVSNYLPFFYNDKEGIVYPLKYIRNRKNRIDMKYLVTDKGYFQFVYEGMYDDYPDAFRMSDEELQLTVARDYHDDEDPFRYTLLIENDNGIFSATPADPGNEYFP